MFIWVDSLFILLILFFLSFFLSFSFFQYYIDIYIYKYFIFPFPHLSSSRPYSRMVVKEATLFVSPRDGRYDATLYRVMEDRHLPTETAFECLLSLPATEYQTVQKVSYQPGTHMIYFIFKITPSYAVDCIHSYFPSESAREKKKNNRGLGAYDVHWQSAFALAAG